MTIQIFPAIGWPVSFWKLAVLFIANLLEYCTVSACFAVTSSVKRCSYTLLVLENGHVAFIPFSLLVLFSTEGSMRLIQASYNGTHDRAIGRSYSAHLVRDSSVGYPAYLPAG